MEDLRDNNYGFELPEAVLEHIEECEEDEDEERLETLDMILDLCDHTDLKMLSDYSAIENMLNEYINLQNDTGALLEFILERKQKECGVL